MNNLEHISNAYRYGKLSHAYIIEGPGNRQFTEDISMALMCSHPVTDDKGCIHACSTCPSCIKAETGNHPDIIHVTHEKPTVLSVGEVRNQIVSDISIKPYYGPYKIYIVDDADLMNENAQNALLKTIEEPQGYAVVFLISDNADGFLQTIRSRCITIRMQKESPDVLVERLMDDEGKRTFEILINAAKMDALEINRAAKELETFNRKTVLDTAQIWFRDLLVYKSTSEYDRLFFAEKKDIIKRISDNVSFENLNNIICAVGDVRNRLDASVKAEAAYESLLLSIRKNQN